jgi:hypothetical protein
LEVCDVRADCDRDRWRHWPAAADVPAALVDYDLARRARTPELVGASAHVVRLANTGNCGAAMLRDLVAWAVPTAAYLRASADTFSWQPPARPQLVRQGGVSQNDEVNRDDIQ